MTTMSVSWGLEGTSGDGDPKGCKGRSSIMTPRKSSVVGDEFLVAGGDNVDKLFGVPIMQAVRIGGRPVRR